MLTRLKVLAMMMIHGESPILNACQKASISLTHWKESTNTRTDWLMGGMNDTKALHPFDIEGALKQTPGHLSSSPPPSAAVALIFAPSLELLMIKRAQRKSDPWSGQMGFPGGKIELDDPSSKATAVRETAEEVGIDLNESNVTYLGRLDDQVTPWITIAAFVYAIDVKPKIESNEEVAAEYWLGFNDLCDPKNRTKINFKRGKAKGRFTAVRLNEQTIWGISLKFIDELHLKIK